MRCKASLLFLVKAAVALSHFHTLCVFSVFMWYDMEFVTAVFIFIVMAWKQVPSTLFAVRQQGLNRQGRKECVCTADHERCFRNKRVQADNKRSDWTCPTAGRTWNDSAHVFFYMSVTDSMCGWTCVCVCSKVRWSFISSQQKRAGVRFTCLSVHQICLDASNLLRVSVQWILHLRWKEKKNCFCCLSAGKCLLPFRWSTWMVYSK